MKRTIYALCGLALTALAGYCGVLYVQLSNLS